MTSNWSKMRGWPLSSLLLYLGLTGAFAGFAAWVLVLGLRTVFDGSQPSVQALLLAIPRGGIFGMILALILHTYWKRHPGRN